MTAGAEAGTDRAVREQIERVLAHRPPRAGAFIVTLYGDVVAPWGGVAWMGNVIDTCAEVGISESLARTAVSRLVASGLLEGERRGRRSYYRLTDAARADFTAAADVLFAPDTGGDARWLIVVLGEEGAAGMDALDRAGFGRVAPRVAIAPGAVHPQLPADGLVFRASLEGNGRLRERAATWWRLDDHASAYEEFLDRFGPLPALLEHGMPSGATCLTARLMLVHEFRRAALADPHLPDAALPEDWPGRRARRLFADLYGRLAAPADAHVARYFVDADGALSRQDALMERRLAALAAVGAPES